MNGRSLQQDMRAAFGSVVRPGFILMTYLCLAVPATIILLTKTLAYDDAALFFAVGTMFTTMILGAGAFALAHDVNDLRLPRRRASVPGSHAAIMISIVSALIMPGLLVAVYYRDWVPAATSIGAALFALFLSVLPFYALSVLIAAIVLATYRDGALFAMNREYVAIAALPAGMVLAALAIWRWRAVLAGSASTRMIFGFQRPRNLSTPSRNAYLKRWPDWMFASMAPVRSRPPPARAMRTLFGEPYAPIPISRRLWQLITQGAIPIAILMWFFYLQHSLHEVVQIIQLLALPVLGVAAWFAGIAFSSSLAKIYRHGHGEMIELSLLPGFGAARAQRRSLYEACLAPPILVLTGLLVTALLVAWMENRATSTYAAITAFAITALLVIAAGILRILTGKDFWRSSVQQVGATGLFLVTLVAALACATGHAQAKGLIAYQALPELWFVLVWVTSTVILYRGARQLTSRPHPFVAI